MAERKSQQKYYPPDYDPRKGSLNTQLGQHHLRDRAKKAHLGIMVIRFEMPYHIWCEGCNALIATGIRFNAEKKAVGNYHSTKIYEFTMRCRFCSHTIVIRTDPQARDYVVVSGAKRKTMDYDPADAGVADLPTEEERTAISKDPLRSLERIVDDKRNAEARRPQLERLEADREIWFDDYSISRRLRKNLRSAKEDDANRLEAGRAKGIEVRLLDRTAEDDELAAQQDFGAPRVTAHLNSAVQLAAIQNAPLLMSNSTTANISTSSTAPTSSSSNNLDRLKRQMLVDRTLFREPKNRLTVVPDNDPLSRIEPSSISTSSTSTSTSLAPPTTMPSTSTTISKPKVTSGLLGVKRAATSLSQFAALSAMPIATVKRMRGPNDVSTSTSTPSTSVASIMMQK